MKYKLLRMQQYKIFFYKTNFYYESLAENYILQFNSHKKYIFLFLKILEIHTP